MKISHAIILPALLVLSGCGSTKQDRAISGGLIGAGAGAVIGSMVGAPVTGAALGGAAGAATGAMTDTDTISLGKVWWK